MLSLSSLSTGTIIGTSTWSRFGFFSSLQFDPDALQSHLFTSLMNLASLQTQPMSLQPASLSSIGPFLRHYQC